MPRPRLSRRRVGLTWAAAALGAAAMLVLVLADAQRGDAAFAGKPGHIVFERNDGGTPKLAVMDRDGGNQHFLIETPGALDFDPVYSADGKRIAFNRNIGG